MKQLKTYEIHYRHRHNGTLDDVFETIQHTSKKGAKEWGQRRAIELNYWFMSVRPSNGIVIQEAITHSTL